MTTTNALTFQLQAGPLSNLKPIKVSIVQGATSSVPADAYISIDCQRGRQQSDFGNGEIIEERNHFVAVAKEGVNRFSGIHVENRGQRAKGYLASMDRLQPIGEGHAAFVSALAVVGKNGAKSVVIDFEDSFGVGYDSFIVSPPYYELKGIPVHEWKIHRKISTMVWGVLKFVDGINNGEVDSGVDNIVLAMSGKSLAVWKRGCDLYLKRFDELKSEVRSLNDRLTELKFSIRKLDAFMKSATAMIPTLAGLEEINAELGTIDATMNEHLDLARTERARLMQELQQVERELGV